MPPQLPFPAAHPFLFLTLFAALFVVAGFLTARLSGWSELARHYAAENGVPAGARVWYGRGARCRAGTRYNHCLTVAANEQGLYIAVIFILRPGHPPLFFPWSDIHTHPAKGWVFDYTQLTFRRTHVWLMLTKQLAEEVLAVAGRAGVPPAGPAASRRR